MNKIAIIVSKFNSEITSRLLSGAKNELTKLSIDEKQIEIFEVPGAIEIPLIAKLLAKAGQVNAIICLGAVIRGETSHYDYVCKQVSDGCAKIMLDFEIPVIFGVLTTETEEQALARCGGSQGNKGADAAAAAIEMINLIKNINHKQ